MLISKMKQVYKEPKCRIDWNEGKIYIWDISWNDFLYKTLENSAWKFDVESLGAAAPSSQPLCEGGGHSREPHLIVIDVATLSIPA